MYNRNVPVYLPRTKVTILVPKVMAKLIFELNYKGLTTIRSEINDQNDAIIEFDHYETFRRNLKRWQSSPEQADKALWTFLKNNVSIELHLIDIDAAANIMLLEHPYTPIIKLSATKLDEFCSLFYASKFTK